MGPACHNLLVNSGRLLTIDTASLYYRAFFGLPSAMRAPDGRAVNAVRGLLDFVARLVGGYSPTHLACAWDEDWRPQWRVELIPSYKTHRLAGPDGTAEDAPEELVAQVGMIREVLAALGVPVIGVPGYEADDVLASLAASFPGEVYVATGDRDLFQLVTGRVSVVYVGRGVARHDLVTPEWVENAYGIPACRYVDFAVLRGDPSDGLPGVRGIGDKTAAALIRAHGGLDGILAAAADPASGMAAGVRAKLLAGRDYLAPARRVVTAVPDLDLGEVPVWDPAMMDTGRLDVLGADLGLRTSAVRVRAALAGQRLDRST